MTQWVEKKKVEDLMTHGVVTVPEDATVIDVVGILLEGNINAVVVVKDGSSKPIGVVSEIDIPKAFGSDMSKKKINEFMSSPVKTIRMSDSIGDASKIMKDKEIHMLVVVDGKGNMRGVLSLLDIIAEIYKIHMSEKNSR